jgi:hypothetical protein
VAIRHGKSLMLPAKASGSCHFNCRFLQKNNSHIRQEIKDWKRYAVGNISAMRQMLPATGAGPRRWQLVRAAGGEPILPSFIFPSLLVRKFPWPFILAE